MENKKLPTNKKWSLVLKMVIPAVIALILINVFGSKIKVGQETKTPFDFKTCMESIPEDVDGLEIIEGSRTRASIIHHMVPVACSAKAVYEKMKAKGADLESGSMLLKVVVEFNGEVISVKIVDSDITYRPLRNVVLGMIGEADFVAWQRENVDTSFLYPIHF